LPQHDADFGNSGYTQESFMNIEGATFTGTFNAIQWNEFGADPS
jgi:hypothetical protein